MTAVASRFDVERAVAGSALPSHAKLIMLTLAIWTDNQTAAIPPESRRSLEDIEAATGLSHATVLKNLDILELAGWLTRKRSKGGRNVRTGYRLLIGAAEVPVNVHPLKLRKTGRQLTSKAATKTGRQLTSSPPAETPPETGRQLTSSAQKQVAARPRKKDHSIQVVEGPVRRSTKPDTVRGTRLPEDWEPAPELLAWARCECPGVDVGDENDIFKDYWLDKAGAAARHVSWDRTWKNWMRRKRNDLARDMISGTPPEAGRWD